jgi:hypothetical protein
MNVHMSNISKRKRKATENSTGTKVRLLTAVATVVKLI